MAGRGDRGPVPQHAAPAGDAAPPARRRRPAPSSIIVVSNRLREGRDRHPAKRSDLATTGRQPAPVQIHWPVLLPMS